MKFITPVALLLQVVTVLAVPTVLPRDDPVNIPTIPTGNNGLPGDADPDPAGPPSWRLDCGSPGTTSMCSAQNSGAHCDPVTGALTIILAGTCGACKCISADQCVGKCG
ncbi:hypothetical protein F5Y01DRAFT_316057 [Xylaria sp. FL0043]|nr:hypothetical protein F5Y01DRAFT_316057 [Xylaria sp. FL0043]